MNKNSETYQLIDDYLLGRLSEDESARIKEHIASDNEFAEKVQMHQAVIDGLAEHASEELKSELNSNRVKPKASDKPVASVLKKLGYAAVLLLLVGVAGYFYLSRPTLSENLYQEYFTPYPNRVTEGARGTQSYFAELSDEDKATITKSLEAYENQEYHSVISNLEKMAELLNEYPALKFYLALSHSQSGNPEKAIKYFEELKSTPEDFYSEVLPWYLSMSYLQNNQPEMARGQLTIIVEKEYVFDEKAKEVLRLLESSN